MTGYTTREVSKLLDMSLGQIRAYARSGVLTASRGPRGEYRFSFQDLVLLRTAKGLAARRIPPSRIRRALCRLAGQLPSGRSLSEVRIRAEGDRVVVSDGSLEWNPESGQVQFDFAVSELAADVAPLARRASQAAHDGGDDMDADEWCDTGVELEAVAPAEARRAYQRALELNPTHPDALVNLGRLLHEDGRTREAEALYRRAVAADPRHATAAFNLGNVLEDLKRPHDAVEWYRRAIVLDPTLADAHFNLARIYERLGRNAAALRHLRSYRDAVRNNG